MSTLATIGDVAEMTGVPVKTIRYYADIGLLPPARTTESRYRLYSPHEIWRLELIRTLRQVGFGLDEIRRLLQGELDSATAIEWQLRALDREIEQLSRRRELLRQAQSALHDDQQSLIYLHALGMAMRQNVETRSRWLTARLREALGGDAVPPAWSAGVVAELERRLPESPTPAQAAAWAELVAMLSAPETAAAMSAHVAPFWREMREGQLDWPAFQRGLAEVHQRAEAAARAGLSPASAEVQALARQWAGLFAQIRGEVCDDDFLGRFATIAPGLVDERSRRAHELIERAGISTGGPTELEIQQLMLDGLAELTMGLSSD